MEELVAGVDDGERLGMPGDEFSEGEHLPSAFSLQVYFLDFPTVERIPKNPVNTSIEPNSLD